MPFDSKSGCCEKSILVPSRRLVNRRAALKCAAELAWSLHAQLILVYIVSPLMITESSVYLYQLMDHILNRQCDEGGSYLARIARPLEQDNLTIQCHVRIGDRIQIILDEARECRAAMIVMKAERSSWLRRCLVGSEADQLLRESTFPVVFINADPPNPAKGVLSKDRIASLGKRPKVGLKANRAHP
jgi:nucleotide-binding universal stress UspA family protein